MKRSRVHGLTALAAATLLMLLLGSPAQASPWRFAAEGVLSVAAWYPMVRSWLTGVASERQAPGVVADKIKQTTAAGSTDDKGKVFRPSGDDGVCLDPGGNRIPCSG